MGASNSMRPWVKCPRAGLPAACKRVPVLGCLQPTSVMRDGSTVTVAGCQ